MDGYLQYHIKITILGAGVDGYLCSGGTGTTPTTLEVEEAVDDAPPRNFERCVWAVVPVDVWDTPTRGVSMRRGSKYKKLSDVTKTSPAGPPPSAAADDKRCVKYGDLVQLQHVATGSHVVVRPNVAAETAPNCFAVDFVKGPQMAASDRCFRILPKYKIRQEGDYIRLKDQV